jgi:DNA polymerase-3 subunit alpha
MERVPTLKSELQEIVRKYPGHLVASTACLGGELATLTHELIIAEKAKNDEEIGRIKSQIFDFITFCKELFGTDFYIEIAPAKSTDQILFNDRVKGIAQGLGVKMIFATDAHYLTEKDRTVHKAYLNSKDGDREVDDFYRYAHLMDNEEAYSNLPGYSLSEFSEMCANTIEIMNKITTYDIFHNPIIPEVSVQDYPKTSAWEWEMYPTITKLLASDEIQERYWVNQCISKLVEINLDGNKTYCERLETEARVIDIIGQKLGNCLFSYFNTFQHYIDLFWECGSLSGPGRGSSVCFLSNYLLGITQLDPVEWELDYWRFLNEERVELPDIDTDLSPSKRKLIFKKIREERGELNVLQVATFGTEGTRSAIQTACRGYRSDEYPNGIDVDVAQYLSGLIPQERGFLWALEDVVNGNEEKDRKPIKTFIQEVNKYPGLLDIMMSIEGLVNKRGQHASGVILYNNSPFETDALMRSPNGDLVTQFSLHDAEALGDTKFDFLVTEVCDKITNGINLLKEDGFFSECSSLRMIYEKYFHPAVIPLEDTRIWDSLSRGDTLDVFQFNSDVGLQAAKAIKPRNPIEMTMANALMRLMGEKGQERPLERYVRLKNNFSLWYKEVQDRGLTSKQIATLEKYYVPRFGVPALQEDLMKVCMDKDIANFTLKEANEARKIVAKKKMDQIGKLKEKFISQCEDVNFGEYIWETTMGPQMGYSFK